MRAAPALLKRLAQMVAAMLLGAAIAAATAPLDRRMQADHCLEARP
jgi:hypothetical protein